MGLIIRLIELLIIALPLIGVMFAGWKAVTRFRRPGAVEEQDPPAVSAQAVSAPGTPGTQAQRWQAIQRLIGEHDRTDTRWLEYELDTVKLLDFPLMTDMAEPVTERFHRAKWRADVLRPATAEALLDDRDAAAEYREAVEEYVSAFGVAESEAIRRRRSHFSEGEQQRVVRAQQLLRVASDSAATPQERERAYGLARRELDGLVVLPERARAQIERGISGELGS
ncbi:MAG: hypothetical protein K0R68_1293 [Mycobacterium sp.]|nr:hypothetical protein [Mycobacterium sp.]